MNFTYANHKISINFFWIFLFILLACAYDYDIEGPVENVIYVTGGYPCYVALSAGGGRQYFYHAASNVAQCEFAERAKNSGKKVKLYGKIGDDTSNNGVLGIEYAGTKAKFWFADKAI